MKQTGRRFDAAAFYSGTNSEAYRYLGAHRTRRSGKDGYVFRTWAPNAAHVSVVGDFCGWNGYAHPMEKNADGFWECFVPSLKRYDTYKFAVTAQSGETVLKADPYAFHAETRPGTASKLYDLGGYRWGMTNGARAAQRHPSTARRSTFTRSTSAHGGGTKTAIFTTTARSRASWRITFWTLATTASSSCPSPSIRLTIPGAISAPAILPQRRATAHPGTLCTSSTICTKRAFPSF